MHLFLRDSTGVKKRRLSKKAVANTHDGGRHRGVQIYVVKIKKPAVGSLSPTTGIFTWGMPTGDWKDWASSFANLTRYALNSQIGDLFPYARSAAKRLWGSVYLAFDPRTGSALGRGVDKDKAVRAAKSFINTYTSDEMEWYRKVDSDQYADLLCADDITVDRPIAVSGLLAFRKKRGGKTV